MQAGRILTVEDDDFAYMLMEMALEGGSCKATTSRAATGESAMVILEESITTCQRPDLVFLDVNLPGANGLEVLRFIKANEELSSIPVLILTSIPISEDKQTALRLGAKDYLVKPRSFDDLRNVVDRACLDYLPRVQ